MPLYGKYREGIFRDTHRYVTRGAYAAHLFGGLLLGKHTHVNDEKGIVIT